MKKILFTLFLVLLSFSLVAMSNIPISKGKQHKHFPEVIKNKKLYFGMSLEDFIKKVPQALATNDVSEYRKTYIETFSEGPIEEITYHISKSQQPQLYEVTIKYKDMLSVLDKATQRHGKPNHNGEWRVSKKEIKEDFIIGIWVFGHKIVYSSTLQGSEWENGFES